MPCVGPVINETVIAITDYGKLYMRDIREHAGLPVTLATYNLGDTDNALVEKVITMPAGSDVIEAVVSPDQRRVVWQIGFGATTELWMSEISGKDMHRLYSTPYDRTTDRTDLDPPLGDVRWFQDGSAIAWRYREMMYALTVC